MVLLFVLIVMLILIGLSCGLMIYQLYVTFVEPGALYYPSKDKAVEEMMKLAGVGKKDVVVDLGSGDGKILIAAAKLGARAIGYEIDPFLVRRSRKAVLAAGVEDRVKIYWKSFWKVDLSDVSVISVYLFPHLMTRLRRLIEKRADHPIRLVCNDYPIPGFEAVKKKDKIYLYEFGIRGRK